MSSKHKVLTLIFGLYLSISSWAGIYNVDNIPIPSSTGYPRYTSNPDNILNDESVKHVEHVLTSLDNDANVKAMVVVVEHVEGDDIFDFTVNVFNKYGIGTSTDRGFILTLATLDRSYHIVTGYGLEAELPDIVCGTVSREVLVPNLKDGNWDRAITQTIDSLAYILTSGSYSRYEHADTDQSRVDDEERYYGNDEMEPLANFLAVIVMGFFIVFGCGLSLRILLFIPNAIYLHFHKPEDVETKFPNFLRKALMFIRDSFWRTGNTYYYFDQKGNDHTYQITGIRWHSITFKILLFILYAMAQGGKGGGSRSRGGGGSRGGGRSGGGGAGGRF